jgi:tRNA threonylcarbamoyladenosine biosynthesis protein TsaB|tara:strand:- start:4 stop:663 length:660 start_codon:yes stop_codon:yes gene_type:complete
MILYIDTAFNKTRIAVKKDSKIYSSEINQNTDISKNLINDTKKILKESNSKKKDIKLIGYNKGPGNFTSLRISLAYIKALSYYLGIPVIELNSFQILGASYFNSNYVSPFTIAIDARMSEIYWSEYENYNDLFLKKNNFNLTIDKVLVKKYENKKNKDKIIIYNESSILRNLDKYIEKIDIDLEKIFTVIEKKLNDTKCEAIDTKLLYIRNNVAKKKNE